MKISGRRGEDSNLEILDKIPSQCCQNVRDFDEQKTGGVGEGKFKKCSCHPVLSWCYSVVLIWKSGRFGLNIRLKS